MYEDASGDLWYSGEDFAYDFASPYDSFHDTTLTLAFTFDEGFQPSSEPITDQLSLEARSCSLNGTHILRTTTPSISYATCWLMGAALKPTRFP